MSIRTTIAAIGQQAAVKLATVPPPKDETGMWNEYFSMKADAPGNQAPPTAAERDAAARRLYQNRTIKPPGGPSVTSEWGKDLFGPGGTWSFRPKTAPGMTQPPTTPHDLRMEALSRASQQGSGGMEALRQKEVARSAATNRFNDMQAEARRNVGDVAKRELPIKIHERFGASGPLDPTAVRNTSGGTQDYSRTAYNTDAPSLEDLPKANVADVMGLRPFAGGRADQIMGKADIPSARVADVMGLRGAGGPASQIMGNAPLQNASRSAPAGDTDGFMQKNWKLLLGGALGAAGIYAAYKWLSRDEEEDERPRRRKLVTAADLGKAAAGALDFGGLAGNMPAPLPSTPAQSGTMPSTGVPLAPSGSTTTKVGFAKRAAPVPPMPEPPLLHTLPQEIAGHFTRGPQTPTGTTHGPTTLRDVRRAQGTQAAQSPQALEQRRQIELAKSQQANAAQPTTPLLQQLGQRLRGLVGQGKASPVPPQTTPRPKPALGAAKPKAPPSVFSRPDLMPPRQMGNMGGKLGSDENELEEPKMPPAMAPVSPARKIRARHASITLRREKKAHPVLAALRARQEKRANTLSDVTAHLGGGALIGGTLGSVLGGIRQRDREDDRANRTRLEMILRGAGKGALVGSGIAGGSELLGMGHRMLSQDSSKTSADAMPPNEPPMSLLMGGGGAAVGGLSGLLGGAVTGTVAAANSKKDKLKKLLAHLGGGAAAGALGGGVVGGLTGIGADQIRQDMLRQYAQR